MAPFPILQSLGYRTLTRAAIALSDLDAATVYAERGRELAERFPQTSTAGIGASAQAMVLLARGQAAAAVEQAQRSVAATEKLGYPFENASSRVLLGEALAAAGDSEGAIAQLESAHAELGRLGTAPRYQDRAASLLRRLGRVVPRAARNGAALEGLSRREQEVIELVADGKTNRQIAGELFLSVRTVDRHVARIFEKLGVSSRAAAASLFERARGNGPR
jgi:DNA-binding NarL/FixJ family response regulator